MAAADAEPAPYSIRGCKPVLSLPKGLRYRSEIT